MHSFLLWIEKAMHSYLSRQLLLLEPPTALLLATLPPVSPLLLSSLLVSASAAAPPAAPHSERMLLAASRRAIHCSSVSTSRRLPPTASRCRTFSCTACIPVSWTCSSKRFLQKSGCKNQQQYCAFKKWKLVHLQCRRAAQKGRCEDPTTASGANWCECRHRRAAQIKEVVLICCNNCEKLVVNWITFVEIVMKSL